MARKRKITLSVSELVEVELDRANVATETKAWQRPPGFIDEVCYAIHPRVHEGHLTAYGAIVATSSPTLAGWTHVPMLSTSVELGRQMADGIRSYALFINGVFTGLLLAESGTTSETTLASIVVRDLPSGAVITANSSGLVRIIYRHGIAIHQFRRWREKPMVHQVISRILNVVPMAPYARLQELLLFAYHELSSRHIGATLVWFLRNPALAEASAMGPTIDLKSLALNLGNERHRSLLRHLLAQNDGGAIIDSENNVVSIGAHLKVSDKSVSLIAQHRGTRHTSAQRFSFDCASAVLVTVSADGPVTVFSDGVNVVELTFFSAELASRGLAKMVPMKRNDIIPSSWSETCGRCGKTSIVEEVTIYGWKEREEASCPICRETIASQMCFQISAHVVKQLPALSDAAGATPVTVPVAAPVPIPEP